MDGDPSEHPIFPQLLGAYTAARKAWAATETLRLAAQVLGMTEETFTVWYVSRSLRAYPHFALHGAKRDEDLDPDFWQVMRHAYVLSAFELDFRNSPPPPGV